MSVELPVGAIAPKPAADFEPFHWLGRVLTNFAAAERAIGQLCIDLDLPIDKGPLCSLQQLCARLDRTNDKRSRALFNRIERWRSLRPLRHLLAHATIQLMQDEEGTRFVVTRHLPLDRDDVTPDRLWTVDECLQLLKIAASDGRSITDQIRNLRQNAALFGALRKP